MSVEIIHDVRRSTAALYCNTTDWAFGPVFTGPGCDQDAQDFLAWIARSPGSTWIAETACPRLADACVHAACWTGSSPFSRTTPSAEPQALRC